MGLDGSGVARLSAGASNPSWLADDGGSLVWSSPVLTGGGTNADTVQSSANGGAPVTLVSGQNGIQDVAVAGGVLYWAGQNVQTAVEKEGYIRSASMAGTPPFAPTNVIQGEDIIFGIAISGSDLYYATWTGTGAIKRAGLDGTNVTPIVSNLQYPSSIAVDATYVYWIESGSLKRATLSGSGVQTLYTGAIDDFAVTSTSIYWVAGGRAMRLAKP